MKQETIDEVRKYMEQVHDVFVDYLPNFDTWCQADKSARTVGQVSNTTQAVINAFVAGFEK